MLEQATKYGLDKQYNAITAVKGAEKAKPLAEFTAAALKEMTKRDVDGGKEKDVTELFELTKAVRKEAGVVQGAEASALPEAIEGVSKSIKDPIAASMMQNPLLQKAAQGDDQEKFNEAMELAKIVAKKGAVQVGKVNGFVRGSVNAEDLNDVMQDLPQKNDPEQIRAAMIQMLSKDKGNNQEIIDKLNAAGDLSGIEGASAGKIALAIMDKANGKGSGKGPEKPKAKADTASKAKTSGSGKSGEEINDEESVGGAKKDKSKKKSGVDKQGGGVQGQSGQPGRDGRDGQTVVVKDGRDGIDGAPGQNVQSPSASQSQSTSQSQSASPQQQAPEKSRVGFEAKDIMDADTPSHGSYKTARNIAIVCAILAVLTGGLGIFLLGALLAGGAALYYKDEMQTEKQQIARQRNIEQGLMDPAEARQQQMEQQMSQEMGQLRQQLRHEQQTQSQMLQELHTLQQPSPSQSVVSQSVSQLGKGSQGSDHGHGPQVPTSISEEAAAVAREKAAKKQKQEESSSVSASPPPPPSLLSPSLSSSSSIPASKPPSGSVQQAQEVQGVIKELSQNKQPEKLLADLRTENPMAKLRKVEGQVDKSKPNLKGPDFEGYKFKPQKGGAITH